MSMSGDPRQLSFARKATFWLVLALGYGLMLRLNYPGHLSTDSVLALHEGRLHIRETWGPALFAWAVGAADRLVTGTGLYVVLSGLILFVAWAAMPLLRPRTSLLAALIAAGVVVLPDVLIYQGIVWKDVLFANTAIGAFVCLAFAVKSSSGRGLGWLAPAALLLAAAGLLRQNGLVLLLPAMAALAWTARAGGWKRAAGLSVGWGLLVALLTLVLSMVAQPQGMGLPDNAGSQGVRIVQHYDLAGEIARDPTVKLPHIDAVDPEADDVILARAGKRYSPERVDVLDQDARLGEVLWSLPDAPVRAEWLDLILHRPTIYLRTRLDDFIWVFATPNIDRCLPVHLGVEGPGKALADLHMGPSHSADEGRLYNYFTWFLDTPATSHVAYALLALLVAVLLLRRGGPADLIVAAMLAGALMFAASFFVISIACDYRYLYFLDMAAITGALYLALDPRLRRG
jgi:hypothetical protein